MRNVHNRETKAGDTIRVVECLAYMERDEGIKAGRTYQVQRVELDEDTFATPVMRAWVRGHVELACLWGHEYEILCGVTIVRKIKRVEPKPKRKVKRVQR